MRTATLCQSFFLTLLLFASIFAGPAFIESHEPTAVVGCTDNWDTTFTPNGANGAVKAVTSAGAGNIYAGGAFTSIQGVAANGVAKWNGTAWSPLGSGVNGTVNSILVSGSDIYVGGNFTTAGGTPAMNIAKWNGSSWSALGVGISDPNNSVDTLAISGNDLYAGGTFRTANGAPGNFIARWDGSSWSSLGPPGAGVNFSVRAIVIWQGMVYVGGEFNLVGGQNIGGLAKWDQNTGAWSGVGTLSGTVYSLAISGDNQLYAGGFFSVPGTSDSNIARWDGTAWTHVVTFPINNVTGRTTHSMAFSGTTLYVAGDFRRSGGVGIGNGVLKYEGGQWSALGSGIELGNQRVYSISISGNTIFVGGDFQLAGGSAARNIATYNISSSSWSAFPGTGLDGPVSAIAVSGTDVYVGGSFVSAGPVAGNRIAKWNSATNTWSSLGGGMTGSNDVVYAIAVAGDKIYAGGSFSSIGGVAANNIAVWNGVAWAPLGSGTNGYVSSIIVRGDDVFIGGNFIAAGGIGANRVAKWNGTSWTGLNSTALPTTVVDMKFMGNDLYVGTTTTTADNPNYFSKFDGTSWTPLGAALGPWGVSSLAVIGSDVYVSGNFLSINGSTVNRVAKWNGSSWSALGNGLPATFGTSGSVKLGVAGNDLIATGNFTPASGAPANRIARWDGSAWTPLGAGLDDYGLTVTSAGSEIYAGGVFSTAGCNSSPYFARWRQNRWTGSSSSDWHVAANWSGGTVPTSNGTVTVSSANAVISSADVSLSSLVVADGRALTIAAGRTLTINGRLDLSNGSLAGPGSLIVNGDLNLTNGNISGLSALTVNGSLYLGGGTIAGPATVVITECRATAVSGGSALSYVNSPLQRCLNSTGTYRFPVGSNGVYAPVELSNIAGGGTLTVEPRSGAYSGAATGLPANRLQRWWSMANGGISQADITFGYSDPEIVGYEPRYKVFSINGGTAQLLSTFLNTVTNRASVNGITSFSAFTMADGPPTPQLLQGRITGASGRGAGYVVVTLTDQSGNVRYTQTNPFGYYKFPDVMSWDNYTLRVQGKRFTFSSSAQTFELQDSGLTINFTATNR